MTLRWLACSITTTRQRACLQGPTEWPTSALCCSSGGRCPTALKHVCHEDLKKYEKIAQKDQLKQIEKEAKELFEKYNEMLEKMAKEKEKEMKEIIERFKR